MLLQTTLTIIEHVQRLFVLFLIKLVKMIMLANKHWQFVNQVCILLKIIACSSGQENCFESCLFSSNSLTV